MKVLFICTQARLRSRTAAKIFEYRYDTRYAGIGGDALIAVTPELIEWSDVIVCMEPSHKQALLTLWTEECRPVSVFTAGIEDNYDYMDGYLISLLKLSEQRWGQPECLA